MSLCCSEVSEGNTLAEGLQKCLTSAVELRSNHGLTDIRFFGNAIKPRVILPPAMGHAKLSPAEATVQGAAQTDSKHTKETSNLDMHYAELLAGAACASRQSLDTLRADAAVLNGDLRLIVASVQQGALKAALAAGIVPWL